MCSSPCAGRSGYHEPELSVTIRHITFASGGLSLEGVLHLPSSVPAPGVAVLHPHPHYGGDMENNVVHAACRALASNGCVALRFNFRGTGRSEGMFDSGAGERDDVRAAFAYLTDLPEVDGERLGLAGYSFGAMVASEVADSSLKAVVLISPPAAVTDLRVPHSCPTLVLGGDEDMFAPPDRLRVLAGAARSATELRIVAGADHSWSGYEDELGEALGAFFAQHVGA